MTKPPEQDTDPRIYLAAERTFLAWIRTGVALMGFGFVVARFGLFLREMAADHQPADAPHAGFSLPVGIALIGIGIVVCIASAIRHRRYIRAIDTGQFREARSPVFGLVLAVILAVIGFAVAVYLAALA